MSAGGSFNPSANPSGGPIDNQQRLQTSPNPSLPPADYSMGYARNFQPPSFFNPFSGYYGANTGMGGFQQPQYGGFQQPQYGGFGGFGGFQQPQYGGFQQPQYGGFQQPFGGGFQQPFMPQPQRPQMPPDFGGGMGNFGGFNPMRGGIGSFGGFQNQGFQNQFGNAYAPPPPPPSEDITDYRKLYGEPQAAQRGTVDQNMSNPAFKQQQDAYNMTDYQRLMQRKDRAANAPPASFGPPMSGMTGLGGMPVTAPSDYEIAQSLGYGDLGITDMRAKRPEEYQQEATTRQARAKSYLDSIGYGQSGFDPSKYEVKREVQPFSGISSLFRG